MNTIRLKAFQFNQFLSMLIIIYVVDQPSLFISNYIGALIFNHQNDQMKATVRSQCTLTHTTNIIDSHRAFIMVKSSTSSTSFSTLWFNKLSLIFFVVFCLWYSKITTKLKLRGSRTYSV